MNTMSGNGSIDTRAKPNATPALDLIAAPSTPAAPASASIQQVIDESLARAGFVRQPDDGTVTVLDTAGVAKLSANAGLQNAAVTAKTYTGGAVALPPPSPPAVVWSSDHQSGAAIFATQLDKAMSDFLTTPSSTANPDGTGGYALPRAASQLSPNMLLAAFMKLQIDDPNNNVKTHDELSTLMSQLRQISLNEQQAKEMQAIQQMKEAEQSADHAALIGNIAMVICIAVAVVGAVFTCGASIAALAAILPALATQQLIMIALALVMLAVQLTSAVANKGATDKLATAESTDNDAKKAQKLAQMLEDQVKAENEIIGTIIESKSKTMDAIMQMINAMFASTVKLQSAAMSQG